MLVLSAAAEAAKLPVYHDPPKYKGVKTAPPTQPPPAPALPPAIVLSETGMGPKTVVDEAGTAHIAWNEGRGDQDDATVYCRIKRGETGCEQRVELTWPKEYGTGDSPSANTDYLGPAIVRAGDQLVVLSKRYPTGATAPDGVASSNNTIAWTSSDGGQSWSPAQIVGHSDLGQVIGMPLGDSTVLLNSASYVFCRADGPAAWCLEVYRPGQFGTESNLSTRRDDNYYPGIALDETGKPVAIAENLDGTTEIRRWTGNGDVGDPAQWTTSSAVLDQPVVTGGPAGAFIMGKAVFNTGPFDVRRLNVGADGIVTPGPPLKLTDQPSQFAALFEDPSGRLHAAWQRSTYEGQGGVFMSSSGAAGFGPEQRLSTEVTNGQINIGAAADGGGFVLYNHTGGVTGAGQIVAQPFGNQAGTGQPGLGGLAGGAGQNANVSCQKVAFGKFDIETAQGCLLQGQGKFAQQVVSEGEVTINGLRLVPDPGSKIIIDPKSLRFDTTGPIHVFVSNASTQVELFHGEIHRDLSKVVPGTDLFEFPSQAFKANVLGFPVAGDIPVRLEGDGVHIPVDVKLPAEFGGFTGRAELIANKSGLQVSSLHIEAGPIPIGALNLKTIKIDWQQGGTWNGHAELEFPATGTLTADISFVNGDFAGATFDLPLNPKQPIGPFVYLLRVNGGLKLEPAVQIQAGATIGAGAPVGDTAPVTENGTFTFTFPRNGPAAFDMTAEATIFDVFPFAQLHLEFTTDGYAQVDGQTVLDLEAVRYEGRLQGWVDAAKGDFSAQIKGGVKVCYVAGCSGLSGLVAMSNAGVIGCGELFDQDGGLEMGWNELQDPELIAELVGVPGLSLTKFLIDHFKVPCNSGKYFTPPPRPFVARSSAGGGQIVTIPRGLPAATLVAVGDAQAPGITVTGPGGVRLVSGQAKSKNGVVLVPKGLPASYAVINNPKPGDYTIAPNPGSVDITRVLASNGYRPAVLKAKLRGRTITYRIANGGNGQRVVFQERGRFGAHTLGRVTKSRGTLRFKPARGAGGRRAVVALIQKDGFTTKTVTVGSFRAPNPPKPGAVKRLKAVHKEHKLTVRWRAAARAAKYVVKVRGSKGSQLSRTLGRKARGVKFSAVRRDERFSVTVQAIAQNLRAGPARRAKAK
jgi:hypothetical protein